MKTDIDNPEQDQSSSTPKHIFILSGQSNMSGRGGVKHQHWDGVVPLECQPHPSILRLSANLEWEQANEPLHYDIDTSKVCGVGPGMSFANALREQLGIECVGLVPCAVGGTAIKKWARGQNLYKTMVNRSKESINKSDGEIKALLWYQGESDTSSRHDAEAYKKNMEKLIQNVREDLGLPSLPVIQVAIATGEGKYVEKVREAQLGMNLPNVVCVDAKGLTLKEDNLHLTTESQAKLGQMLADAFSSLHQSFHFHFPQIPKRKANSSENQTKIMETVIPNPEQDQSAPTPKHIFILSGQSNMAGRGGVTKLYQWDGVVSPESQPHPSIFRLSAKLEWEPAREPLHIDIDTRKTCGVGPGMSFVNAVREMLGNECIGLVPCAVGGTAIKEWARGEELYENMVKRSKESVKSKGEIKALLWYQGESDTLTQEDAEAYKGNMETLIHNVREDLGLPSLPIIQVAIVSGDEKYIEKVREAQFGINLPNVLCVDAKGLPLKEDNLHLTTEAQVKLGQILADAFRTHVMNAC
ncbi:hypothetical protein COLO4_32601 [Corchorus olitorius]|uniref:Sialate O-acetylesterase domain-containing protein n=1 Tax=Corchorus olitorius TaxID=93759 RepID=A0A1R3GYW9_9ROSI|nr:hypothetical protein COLO4_32601 [Corchorus olitorius]